MQIHVPDETKTKRQAEVFLDRFSRHTSYVHGEANPFYNALKNLDQITEEQAITFFCTWWSFSRRTPQILLRVAAAYTEQAHRASVLQNYLEEDGLAASDRPDTHYDLLEQLIEKLGGKLVLDNMAEVLITRFMRDVIEMPSSPARAAGILAGVEHPAMDIARMLNLIAVRADRKDLADSDVYLQIHTQVEPTHIVWAHGLAVEFGERSPEEYQEMVRGFQDVMEFWETFWLMAIYPTLPAPLAAA